MRGRIWACVCCNLIACSKKENPLGSVRRQETAKLSNTRFLSVRDQCWMPGQDSGEEKDIDTMLKPR